MICPHCYERIPQGVWFCTQCGQRISRSWPFQLEGIGRKIGFVVLVLIVGGMVWQKYSQMRQERDALREEVQRLAQKIEKLLEDSLGIKFVMVRAGEFTMGSNEGESDEKPLHRVKISKPFYWASMR